MMRIVRLLWMFVAMIYLSACTTVPAYQSSAEKPVTASDCRDVSGGAQAPSTEPVPCAPARDSRHDVGTVIAVLAVVALIALAVSIHHIGVLPGWQGG